LELNRYTATLAAEIPMRTISQHIHTGGAGDILFQGVARNLMRISLRFATKKRPPDSLALVVDTTYSFEDLAARV
jgi:hypothetical protein